MGSPDVLKRVANEFRAAAGAVEFVAKGAALTGDVGLDLAPTVLNYWSGVYCAQVRFSFTQARAQRLQHARADPSPKKSPTRRT